MAERDELIERLAVRLRTDADARARLLQELQGRRQRGPADDASVGIVVTGIHCRFPGSPDARSFFDSLRAGGHAVDGEVRRRWKQCGVSDVPLDSAGLRDVFEFDSQLFRMSPREAEALDPHHRLMLESAFLAIQDAGYIPERFAKQKTGVFVAVYNQDFAELAGSCAWEPESLVYVGTGSAHALLPNRLSYLFDFRGPSEVVDTACSSSLVALHRAVRAIRSGECEQAIVGGVSLLLSSARLDTLRRIGILSPDGRCALFDENPRGQVMGEGVASLIVKREDLAIEDGDAVYGRVLASGVNHRGACSGSFTLPDPDSQVALIQEVYASAGLSPADVSYVEAHGNGGRGDLAELEAFQRCFSPGTRIGSVKGNIGCLEAAGGMSQLMKVLLAFEHGEMPRTIGHRRMPSSDRLRPDRCRVLTENVPLRQLQPESGPLRVAIHAYGLGGVQAHVVLERASLQRAPVPSRGARAFVLSARSEPRLRQAFLELEAHVAANPGLALDDLAYTLACGRASRSHRACVVAGSTAVLRAKLGQALSQSNGAFPPLAAGVADLEQLEGEGERAAIRAWLAGEPGGIEEYFRGTRQHVPPEPLERRRYDLPPLRGPGSPHTEPAPGPRHAGETLEGVLAAWLSRQAKVPISAFVEGASLRDCGLDSVACVDLCDWLSRKLKVSLSPLALIDAGSLHQAAAVIRGAAPWRDADGERIALRRAAASVPAASDNDSRGQGASRDQERLLQLQALREGLRPADGALLTASREYGGRFEVLRDARENIWIFLRCGPGNTFDSRALQAFADLLRAVKRALDAGSEPGRVLYITHDQHHFSLGGDRVSFLNHVSEGDAAEIARVVEAHRWLLDAFAELPCLTVGVAYGSAQGGGMELLMTLDQQFVWPGVRLGFPEVKSGLIAGMGGVSYVAAIAGPQVSLRLNVEGALISSEEAFRLGLISHLSERPYADALEYAEAMPDLDAALEVRQLVLPRKHALLAADVDVWRRTTASGGWLRNQSVVLQHASVFGRSSESRDGPAAVASVGGVESEAI